MNHHELFQRYQELQTYVDWTEEDARLVASLAALVGPHLSPIIDDFYEEISRHPQAAKVITGGAAQIARLKGTLNGWIRDLFTGRYDADFVAIRSRVGWRHVEIGLDQVYTNVALSRIRSGLLRVIHQNWQGDIETMKAASRALNKLLDLDLAVIEDAYQAEYVRREQRTERLASIGQVAGGVAHELRNPLNVVKTSVYFLLNAQNATVDKTREHLARIERHVDLADGVITALSNFARLPVPEARPFAVEPCVREALERNPIPASISVSLEIPATVPRVSADWNQIQIVLGNVIRNARDAMAQTPDARLTISATASARAVDVAVADNGVGIPREALARVTEPLYTTKTKGLGLGLAIARSILDKNQGTLRVTSEPGRGSTFVVTLPAAADESFSEDA